MIDFQLIAFVALLVYVIDYGLGRPSSNIWNEKALLAVWPLLLAKRRLNGSELLQQKANGKKQQLAKNRMIFSEAKDDFTWEHPLGICPICAHFWGFIIAWFVLSGGSFIIFIINFGLSHTLIRLLNKYT